MAITSEEMKTWKARHAAVSARFFPLHKRWLARDTLDPEARAVLDQDMYTYTREFEQFKAMPDEVWDELGL